MIIKTYSFHFFHQLNKKNNEIYLYMYSNFGYIRARKRVLTVLELSNQNELTYATTNVINYPGVSVTSGGQSDQDSGRK